MLQSMVSMELLWHMDKLDQVCTVFDYCKLNSLNTRQQCEIKTKHMCPFSGKTYTLMSPDGVAATTIERCFRKIAAAKENLHYKVPIKYFKNACEVTFLVIMLQLPKVKL